ncbi:carboxyl-terminal processing protease [Sphingobacterium sp. JUb78]|jgi:carboxyl-terminal processing protease|uniref:S41 family peptidase n=1 Tax=Sphingobacterium sp. B16(2022) TaxID=2914044 RepID=UPI0010507A7F|nr:S41 family peptidase [Sphingobacterium sp. B16(2022)]NJI74670.1 S41 family peptidase [Sphingobacterium sp. B16(2022)]TCR12817.1 carboxyl-terminal processing protease [Sphingobacterium sp. JUb78]
MQGSIKRNIFVAATYAGVLLVGLLLGQKYADEQGNKQSTSILAGGLTGNSEKVQYLVNLISDNYVDKVSLDTIQDEAIQHIITRLDPFSTYLKPNERLAQAEALEGTFDGIGVEYFNLNDTLLVVGMISAGPAEKSGMKIGDRLVKIANRNIAGVRVTENEVDKLIRGKKGSTVDIIVKRNNEILTTPLKVVRDQVSVSTLDASYMIAPKVAYVKIRRFGHQTSEDFKIKLRDLRKSGAQDLILDLRGNGGGYVHTAIEIASMFFKDKRLLMYTEGANELRRDYFSKETGDFSEGRIVILINEDSASASEIVTGALQDLDRGTVVGRRSYGKGLVQEQFDFADGSAVNLTVARYYTPLGRCIQRKYTRANYDQSKYMTTFDLWTLDTEFNPHDLYTTSKGKMLFGGGGIQPDVLIPIDSNEISAKYREIYHSNSIQEFVYDRFTKKLPAYSIENFLSGYNLPDSEFNDFISFLLKKGIAVNKLEADRLHQIIQSDIEALVGRYYFGREAYFKIKNRKDHFVAGAFRALGIQMH